VVPGSRASPKNSSGFSLPFVYMDGGAGIIITGQAPGGSNYDRYLGTFTSLPTFGTNTSFFDATSGTGSIVGFANQGGPGPQLLAPFGYHSGDFVTTSDTWSGATFASLFLTPGTYEWTWGTGAHADNLTLQIGPIASVPGSIVGAGIPGLASALGGLYLTWRRKRKERS
jgi:hypothetical protein